MAKYFFFKTGGSLFGSPVSDWWEELKRAEYHTAIRPQRISSGGYQSSGTSVQHCEKAEWLQSTTLLEADVLS